MKDEGGIHPSSFRLILHLVFPVVLDFGPVRFKLEIGAVVDIVAFDALGFGLVERDSHLKPKLLHLLVGDVDLTVLGSHVR